MPPFTLDDLHQIGQINHLKLFLTRSAVSTDRWIVIADTDDGHGECLARLLYPSVNVLIDRAGLGDQTYWVLPYVTAIDETLIALIDVLAELRRAAGVVQLTLTGFQS
jgi:hypothetical protein